MQNEISKEEVISFLKKNRKILEKKFGLKKIALFGSVAKDSMHKESDIDILVELESDTLFRNFFYLKEFLERNLQKRIDLGTFDALKKSIKEEVLKEAIYV